MSIENVKIPSIGFRAQDRPTAGVELFELESLYKRAHEFGFDTFAPHRVNFHHLVYITEGNGTHFIDFNRHSYEAGSFVFINTGQVHAFDVENQPQGLLIIFTQAFLDTIRTTIRVPIFSSGFSSAAKAPVLTVRGALKESFEALLTEIKNVSGEARYDGLIFKLLFTALVLKLHQIRSDKKEHQVSEEQRQQFTHFLSLIEGFSAQYQFIGFNDWSPDLQWGYWAAHIDLVRFRWPETEVYAALHQLASHIEPENTFVMTSNVDTMFARNGFDPERIYTPQGDYALLQCTTPCWRTVWPWKDQIDQILASTDPDTQRLTKLDLVPHCPNCGGPVFPNVRVDNTFIANHFEQCP